MTTPSRLNETNHDELKVTLISAGLVSAIVPANSCLTAAANAMISPCIPLWNFGFDTQKLCNVSPWIKKLKTRENIM